MKKPERKRQLDDRYPDGISRAAAARELRVSPTDIPVDKLTRIYIPGRAYPRIDIDSLLAWYYSRVELGVFR